MRSAQSGGQQRSDRRRGTSVLALTALVAGLLLSITSAPGSATAAPFAITTAADSLFVGQVTISGTKDAQATIEIPAVVGSLTHCIETPGSDATPEAFSCTFPLPDGEHSVRVVHTSDLDPALDTEATVVVRVLGPPSVNGTSPVLTTGSISGSGHPGAGIELTGDVTGSCGEVQPSGFWSCALPITASGSYDVIATQLWQQDPGQPGGSSPPITFVVDRDIPALAVIGSPAPGTRLTGPTVTFSGSGENGARVDISGNGAPLCSAQVTGTSWSCSASLPDGSYSIQAIQWDAAGNASGATPAISITVRPPAATAPVTPPRPGGPQPTAPTPTPAPSPSQNAAPAPMPVAPFFPPPVGGQSGLPPLDTWDTPTHYGAAIPSLAASVQRGLWLSGLALAIAFVALVALPARLLASAIRSRVSERVNAALDEKPEPLLEPRVTAALALAAAIVLAALAGGIQGEVRYLRLVIGIGIALTILNGVGVALAAKTTARALGGSAGMRLVPLFLGLAAISALISRAGGIQPPILMGVVLAAAVGTTLDTRGRGLTALAQISAITLLGALAWVAHSSLGPVEGLWPSLLSETLGALCIAALGSVAVLLIPVTRMPGRTLFEWSRGAWLAASLVAVTLAAVVVAGGETFPVLWIVALGIAFCAVALAAWSWIRLVEPGLNDTEEEQVGV